MPEIIKKNTSHNLSTLMTEAVLLPKDVYRGSTCEEFINKDRILS
jgi:hypothetical protein